MKPAFLEYGFDVEPKGSRPSPIRQIHTSEIREIKDASELRRLESEPVEADAIFTLATQFTLFVSTADCLPVLIYSVDPQGPIAAVHCGWRGAARGIVRQTLERLSPWRTSLRAILGPSLLGCCFEVKDDLVEEFRRLGNDIYPYVETRTGTLFFHLSRFIIAEQLKDLPADHIDTSRLICTYCSVPGLPSYRRNKSTDPRLCNWIRKNI